jgi:hypothetical protein
MRVVRANPTLTTIIKGPVSALDRTYAFEELRNLCHRRRYTGGLGACAPLLGANDAPDTGRSRRVRSRAPGRQGDRRRRSRQHGARSN